MNDKARDLADSLSKKTAQLSALLAVASSGDFHEFSEAIRIDYLWSCGDISDEIRDEFDTYDQEVRKGRKPEDEDMTSPTQRLNNALAELNPEGKELAISFINQMINNRGDS